MRIANAREPDRLATSSQMREDPTQASPLIGRYQELSFLPADGHAETLGERSLDKSRITQTLQALTTVLFRCPGLAATSGRQDAFGWRDLFFWTVFLLVAAAWYQFLFLPTREQNTQLRQKLEHRENEAHQAQVKLDRVRAETTALRQGQGEAWERAGRVQLGWLAPGEALDPALWKREHPRWQPGVTGAERERHRAELIALLRTQPRRSLRTPPRPVRPQVASLEEH
jgi:hypothetical protein